MAVRPAVAPPLNAAHGIIRFLVVLAAAQAVLLASVPAPASRRIVSVAMLGVFLAESWRPWLSAGSPRLVVALLAGLSAANHAGYVAMVDPPVPLRLIQVCVATAYAGIAFTMVATRTRLLTARRAGMAAVAGAVVLASVEMVLGERPEKFAWRGGPLLSRDTMRAEAGFRAAYSEYPDDPRGYFEDALAEAKAWRVGADSLSRGALEIPDPDAAAVRLRIDRTSGQGYAGLMLWQGPLRLRKGHRHTLDFRARALFTGELAVALGASEEPWGDLAPFRTMVVDTLWREFRVEFDSMPASADGRLHLDAGRLSGWVEIARVRLRDRETGERITPSPPARHRVRYVFDSLSCRRASTTTGTNPPADTRRLLVLGGASALGVGVHAEDTFAARLEARLSVPGQAVSTVNCGSPAAGVPEALAGAITARDRAAPDLVVFVIGLHDAVRWRGAGDDDALPNRLDRLFLTWNEVRRRFGGQDHGRRPVNALWDGESLQTLMSLSAPPGSVAVLLRTGDSKEWAGLRAATEAAARRHGVGFVDAGPFLLARHRAGELVVHPDLDPRPNELANALAADTVAAFLRASMPVRAGLAP